MFYMRKELKLVAVLLLSAPLCFAQQTNQDALKAMKSDQASFTFTESQLGEDDDVTQNVIMVNSNNNVYTSNIGYLFSPMRFKYRAYGSRYNDVYFNGVNVNNAENGQFNYSTVGGMNDATRGQESVSPYESNMFGVPNLGGASNYNFRASNYAAGSKATLSGCNRNYVARAMFTHATGLMKNGWAFMGTVGYRWGKEGFSEGTFYNSLGYFLSAQKVFNDNHSLSFATWGNPSERSQQGASTDEAYWLANDRYYNPYWGYQNGKKRNSRVVNNYEPTALITWDYKINDKASLTTSLLGRYVMYSSTKLNYNNANNPAPDYWKNFPSYQYNVWEPGSEDNTEDALAGWWNSYNYWTASKANRQINWDNLYFANQQLNAQGADAAYYIQAKHNDHLTMNLSSTFNFEIDKRSKFVGGVQLGTNKGMHYQTMEDMLGAKYLRNINTYAVGTYPASDPRVQYDLNNPNAYVQEGDRFGYDYDLNVQNPKLWAKYEAEEEGVRAFLAGQIGGTKMWRTGHMRHGMAANYSYGNSQKAYFLDGGVKMGSTFSLGHGNSITLGLGLESRAPRANVAFVAPEINNDFVDDLKCEQIVSAELGYALNTQWVRANLTGYYACSRKGNEWQNFYFDDVNSFTYVSLSDVAKDYYGVELGIQLKLTSNFRINLIGSMSDAKYVENTNVKYMLSTEGETKSDVCYNKDMRESGTPLTVGSIGLSYNVNGWWLDLKGNYYDRIYLSYSPNRRYGSTMVTNGDIDNAGNYIVPEQAQGEGGFMLDASIGRQFNIGRGQKLGVNLMLTNVLNNTDMVSGGYEQSRSDYTTNSDGTKNDVRTYKFSHNPKKYYAQGINGMLNVTYRF